MDNRTDEPRLSPELKAKWLEALRSGKYQQQAGGLRKKDCFCCLGVLCDLIDPNGWRPPDSDGDVPYEFDNEDSMGSLPVTMNRKFITCAVESRLITMNDEENKSFSEIADYVEANL